MHPSVRIALVALAAVGLALATAVLVPHSTEALGLDFWSVPELRSNLEQAEQNNRELDLELSWAQECIRRKGAIIATVADQQMDLREAAQSFREINGDRPTYFRVLRVMYPGESDDERICRNVIALVAFHLEDRPGEAARVVAALQAELDGYLLCAGTLRLDSARAED